MATCVDATHSDITTKCKSAVANFTTNGGGGSSSVATLSGLALSSGSLNQVFASGSTTYSATVPYTTTSTTVTATSNESHATLQVSLNSGSYVSITSAVASSSLALSVGVNTVRVLSTAQDGTTTSTYTTTITRTGAAAVSSLSNLTISSGTLSPSFASGSTSYSASVSNATTSITVTPTATNAFATIQVKLSTGSYTSVTSGVSSGSLSLATGVNTITVLVTAQDLTTTAYTISVTRQGAAPAITNVTATTSDGTYSASASAIAVTVTFSAAVSVSGSPQIALNTTNPTSTTRYAIYSGGTGTATLTFNYTIVAGDTSPDLDYASTSALTLNSGTISATSDATAATLTLASPAASGSLGANKAIVIDTAAPTVTSFSSTTGDGTYKAAGAINITATLSKSVTTAASITVTLDTGATVVLTHSGAGTTLTGTYTVTAGQSSADLTVSSYSLTSAPTDAAGNVMTSTTVPSGANNIAGSKAIVIDAVAPAISGTSAASITVNSASINYTSSKAGTYYYLVYLSATTAPADAATVIAQGTAVTKGTASTNTSPSTISVSGLSALTGYKVYLVVKDASGNTSAIATPIAFTTLGAARTPTMSAAAKTDTGFTFTITNYDSNYTFTPSSTNSGVTFTLGVPSAPNYPITVNGLLNAGSDVVTITVARSGYAQGSATITGAAKASQVLTFAALTDMTIGGSTQSLSASLDSGLTLTKISNSLDKCTISGNTITAVLSGTCSISVSNAGDADHTSIAQTQTFTVNAGAALTPSFGTITRTTTGFTVVITNFDAAYTFTYGATNSATASEGSTSGAPNVTITVGGLSPGQSSTLTVYTNRTGFGSGSNATANSALSSALLSIINVVPTGDGATFRISTTGATAGTPTAVDQTHTGQTLTVTADTPVAGTYTISGALNGDILLLSFPWTANSGYAGTSPTTKSITVTAPPGAPTSLVLTNSAQPDGTLKVTWSAPSADGGSAVTGYEYQIYVVGTSPVGWISASPTFSSPTYTLIVGGLTNAKYYVVSVRALNSIGSGVAATSNAIVGIQTKGDAAAQLGQPGTPVLIPGDRTLAVSFTTPNIPNDYNAITDVQYSLDGGTSWTTVITTGSATRSFTLASLTNGTTYAVMVHVRNIWGAGTASSSTSAKVAASPTVPGSISWSVTANTATVTFSASTPGSNSVSYEYQVVQRDDDSDSWGEASTLTSSSSPLTISVTNGKKYHLRIRAKNDANLYSSWSASQIVSTSLASNASLTGPANKALTLGQNGFTLSVSATAPSGQSITAYQWYKKDNSSPPAYVAISGATTNTFTKTGNVISGDASDYVLDVTTAINGTTNVFRSNASTVTVSAAAPTVGVTTLAGATIAKSYSTSLSGTGGVGPYTWASSDLPSWLSLSSGRLTGTPDTANVGLTFHVVVTDANSISSVSTQVTIVVSAAMTITTKTLNIGGLSKSYSQSLAVSGGAATYTWALSGEDAKLPSGLSLSADGQITGTPTKTGSSTFTVKVTDSNSATTTASFTLTVSAAVPGAPTSLAATAVENGAINLNWTNPVDDGGSTITYYIIEYSSGGDDEDKVSTVQIDASTSRPYKLTGLTNGKTYTIDVKAKNAGSTGPASNTITKVPAGKATTPTSISAVNSDGGISLRWKQPADNGGYEISSYSAQCREYGKTSESDWFDVSMSGKSESDEDHQNKVAVTKALNGSMSNGKSYECRVRANTATIGAGDWSSATTQITLASVPDQPAYDNSTPYAFSGGKLTVKWQLLDTSHNGGSVITGYRATANKQNGDDGHGGDNNSDGTRSCSTNDATTTSCIISGIAGKGYYTVKLYAVNAIGTSVLTGAGTITVHLSGQLQVLTVTSPVDNAKKMGDSDFSIGATFSSGLSATYVSTSEDVCKITGEGKLVHIVSSGTCQITISQNGHQDDDDDSDWGNYVPVGSENLLHFVISPSSPGAPSISSVTPGNATLGVAWNVPTSGGPVTGYELQYSTDLSTWEPSTPIKPSGSEITAKLKTISGLVNGTAYYIRIRSTNTAGHSDWVVTGSTFTPYTVPGKSVISKLETTAATSSAKITWTAPSNGGSAITGYGVTATPTAGGTALTCTAGPAATNCTINSLINKAEYSFVLFAKNKAGQGANSDASVATLSGLSQTITVTYPLPTGWFVSDGGYQINASANAGPVTYVSTTTLICTVDSKGAVIFVSNGTCLITLTQSGAGTNYDPAPSVDPVRMEISANPPTAPTITSVTNSPAGLVIVWRASLKGGAITYKVTANPGNGSPTVCETSVALTCTIGSGVVTKGVSQTIVVNAWNAVSTGSTLGTPSSSQVGMWQVLPDVPASKLTAPNISIADPADGKAVKLYWAHSANNGGAAITSYVAKASASGSVIGSCSVSAGSDFDTNGYACSIGGLVTGTSYAVKVYAINSIGESATGLSLGTLTPGVTPTINYPGLTSIAHDFGYADFNIAATVSSGGAPLYTRNNADSSVCSINAVTGRVHIIAVGTCRIYIDSPANTGSGFLAAAQTGPITLTVNAVAPNAAIINAVAASSGSIKVSWTEPEFKGGGNTSAKAIATFGGTDYVCDGPSPCTINTTAANDGHTFSVVVKVTNTSNSGLYSVTSPAVSATPYSEPLAPLPVTALGGNNQITLSWTVPSNTDFAPKITGYEVYQSTTESGSYSLAGTWNATTNNFTPIANGTTYWYKVRATTADPAVHGVDSSPVSGTTNIKPTPPQLVSATPSYSGAPTLVAKWSPPASNGGTPITGYTASAGGQQCTAGPSETTCEIPSLSSGSSYTVSVTATNAVGTSDAATFGPITTITTPTTPTITSATPDNAAGTMTLLISGVADPANAPILSYTVVTNTGAFTCSVSPTTVPLACVIYGLTYRVDYTFKVKATNIAGDSGWSAYVAGAQLVLAQTINSFGPYADQSFKSAKVSISAGADSGLSVTLSSVTTSVCTMSANLVTFLGIGTCTIHAASPASGKYSDAPSVADQSFAISAYVPDSPDIISLAPGASKITATWTSISTVSQLGGSTLKNYVVSWATKSDFSDASSATTSSTSMVITGLTPMTAYIVEVKVVTNDFADGSNWSDPRSTTPFGLPVAPTLVTNSFDPSNVGALTAGWVAVSGLGTGGTVITGYTAEAYVDNAPTYTPSGRRCTTSETSCLISGLNGALHYVIKVYATNAAGDSPVATSVDSQIPGAGQSITALPVSVPHDIRSFIVDASSSSGLPLHYSIGTQTPTDVIGTRTVCSVDAITGVVTVDLAGTCTILLDQDGTTTGQGGATTSYLPSPQATVTVTVTPTDPTVVQRLVVTTGDTSLGITWLAPVDDGGRAINGYRITWFPSDANPGDTQLDLNGVADAAKHKDGGRFISADPTVLTYAFNTLINGNTYTIEVEARNRAYVDGVTGTHFGTP